SGRVDAHARGLARGEVVEKDAAAFEVALIAVGVVGNEVVGGRRERDEAAVVRDARLFGQPIRVRPRRADARTNGLSRQSVVHVNAVVRIDGWRTGREKPCDLEGDVPTVARQAGASGLVSAGPRAPRSVGVDAHSQRLAGLSVELEDVQDVGTARIEEAEGN